ncbi:MAG: hypothetical protein LBS09_08690, partial [Bacteroidales bacterium]|nr:hypothetical protein [Bacteroidales bacterium]
LFKATKIAVVRKSTVVSPTGVALIFISRAWKTEVFHLILQFIYIDLIFCQKHEGIIYNSRDYAISS